MKKFEILYNKISYGLIFAFETVIIIFAIIIASIFIGVKYLISFFKDCANLKNLID